MVEENRNSQNEMYEYKMLMRDADGLTALAWYHHGMKIGPDKELDTILTNQSAEGWNLVHFESNRVLLRRKAR
jgi:hypothetical protein